MTFSHLGIINSASDPFPSISFSTSVNTYTDSTYRYYRLTSSGFLTVSNAPLTLDAVLVGGGGGGGSGNDLYYYSSGGGGGAGRFLYRENIQIFPNLSSGQSGYNIGAGGAAGMGNGTGNGGQGGLTVLSVPTTETSTLVLIAVGGGGGGGSNAANGGPGGSGGGGGGDFTVEGEDFFFGGGSIDGTTFPPTQSFGNVGAGNYYSIVTGDFSKLVTSPRGGSGGGGAGGAATPNNERNGGEGGTGKTAFDYTGSSLFKVAAGGGGGGNAINPGLNYVADNTYDFGGGVGGALTDNAVVGAAIPASYNYDAGRDRYYWQYAATSGLANRGGGGGGAPHYGYNLSPGNAGWSQFPGANGGSGVMILRVRRDQLGE